MEAGNETTMAKAKKRKATKVKDMRARKQVKGGAASQEDPCMGGQITWRKAP